MTAKTITLNPVEPVSLNLRHVVGMPFDLRLTMKKLDGAPADPTGMNTQLVLSPRSIGHAYGYDMPVADAVNGIVSTQLPGNFFTDQNGYRLEVYSRDAEGVPTELLALGEVRLIGGAYTSLGPLGAMSVPVITRQGDKGDKGEPGIQGQRGSVWTTGNGAPVAPEALTGDMYLDEDSGDVWRYDGTTWLLGSFE